MQFIRKYGNLYDAFGNELGPDTQANRVILGQKAGTGDPGYNYAQPLPSNGVAPSYPQQHIYPTSSQAPILPVAQPVQQPTNTLTLGGSGAISDLLNGANLSGGGAPSAPTPNPFSSAIQQYIGQGTQQAYGPNPFAGQMSASLSTPGPTAPTTQTFTAQGMPAAPTMAIGGANPYQGDLTASEQRLQDLINNPNSLQDSASYKFRVQQGQEALQRSLGARGLLNSGNRLTELTKYGQDMGSQEYEAENARRQAMYNAASGNYNTATGLENTRVGQANATTANIYGTQVGGVNASNATNAAAIAAANTAANARYGIDTTAATAQKGIVADLYNNANTASNQRYGIDTQAGTARANTLANLYQGADTTAAQRYGIDTQAATARANTLADLYRTNVGAQTAQLPYQQAKIGDVPYWASNNSTIKYDQYGRPLQV